ncbi:MAG: MFS transporter [Oscillospiraceae bacterium]|nr:MFS transporter [Oscillospiraceae bacterium]
MRKASKNAQYAALQGSFWAGYAALWGYIGVLLLAFGFDDRAVGIITASAPLLCVAISPSLGSFVDRSRRIHTWHGALFLTAFGCVGALALRLFPRGTLLPVSALLFIAAGTALASACPFVDSLAMEATDRGEHVTYGFGRGVGSVCYAATILLTGFYIEQHDTRDLLSLFIILFFVFTFFLLLFCSPRTPQPVQRRGSVKGAFALLRAKPRFVLTMLGCMFFYMSHSIPTIYGYAVVGRVGGGESAIGMMLAISAMTELPAMTLVSHLRARKTLSCGSLLRIAAVGGVLKCSAYLLAPNVFFICLFGLLQFFQFGFYLPASVYYVEETIEPENRVKGQSLIHVAGSGLGAASGNFLGGFILDAWGASAMLFTAAVCAGLSFLIFTLASHRAK